MPDDYGHPPSGTISADEATYRLDNREFPRVTVESIEERIEAATYAHEGTTTVAFIRMCNGYVSVGTSACVDPRNYDAELGKRLAYEDAFRALWPLEGYLLAERQRR